MTLLTNRGGEPQLAVHFGRLTQTTLVGPPDDLSGYKNPAGIFSCGVVSCIDDQYDRQATTSWMKGSAKRSYL